MTQRWKEHISGRLPFLVNESVPVLVEQAIQGNEGKLSLDGALVVKTEKFTGRAAEDKYVVTDEYSRERIDWENNIRGMGPSQFEGLKYEVLKNFNSRDHTLYIMERSVGADPAHSLGVRFITNSASHALFARNIFRENVASPSLGHFTVYHCPDLELDPLSFGLRSSTAIAINFSSQEVVIV